MPEIMEKQSLFTEAFDRFLPDRKADPAWALELRKAGIARFAELGIPTTDHEEWRFTPVYPLADTPFRPATQFTVAREQLTRFDFGEMPHSLLVFINGRYAPELSAVRPMPKGVEIHNLATVLVRAPEAIEGHLGGYLNFENHPFAALNTAFMEDGACLHVPRGVVIEEPIHLLFVSTASEHPTVSHPRSLIVAGESAQVTLIESYVGANKGVYFTNAVTEIAVGPNAVVDHYKSQRESMAAYHVANMKVQIERDGNFRSHAITLGGGIARNDIAAAMNGEGIECTLNGLYLVDGQRLADSHTVLDHAKPHCDSHQVYKGILDGRGRGVFNGKIYVRPDAQKTDAKQTNQALLLSDDAQINTKPQLEIFADDVKCTHGATVGQLDRDQLFYLRARGIRKEDARSLLIHAFAMDILDRIRIEPLRRALDEVLLAQLPKPH